MEIGNITMSNTYQVVIWFDSEQLSEVPEGQRGIGFEPEIRVVVCWSQVASLAVMKQIIIIIYTAVIMHNHSLINGYYNVL